MPCCNVVHLRHGPAMLFSVTTVSKLKNCRSVWLDFQSILAYLNIFKKCAFLNTRLRKIYKWSNKKFLIEIESVMLSKKKQNKIWWPKRVCFLKIFLKSAYWFLHTKGRQLGKTSFDCKIIQVCFKKVMVRWIDGIDNIKSEIHALKIWCLQQYMLCRFFNDLQIHEEQGVAII